MIPSHGRQDLQDHKLRHVSEAFAEDPLRILRTARFAARLQPRGFTIAQPTMALMRQMVDQGEVSHLVPERVWQEILRALHEQEPGTFFEVLRDCGALAVLIPELEPREAFFRRHRRLAPYPRKQRRHPCVRFAALLSPLAPADARHRARALKAPNDCQDLTRLTTDLIPTIRTMTSHDADLLLDMQDGADVWRRADRFSGLLSALKCALPEPERHKVDWLESAQHAATGCTGENPDGTRVSWKRTG